MKKVLVVGRPDTDTWALADGIASEINKTESVSLICGVEEELEEMGRCLDSHATYNEFLLLYALYQRHIDTSIFSNQEGVVVDGGIVSVWAYLAEAHDDSVVHPAHPQIGMRLDLGIKVMALLMFDTIQTFDHIVFLEAPVAETTEPLTVQERHQIYIRQALDWLETAYFLVDSTTDLDDQVKKAMGYILEYPKADTRNPDGDPSDTGGADGKPS